MEENAITLFWDDYQKHGVEIAIDNELERSGNLLTLEQAVPELVEQAKERDIDMIKFLTELDVALAEKGVQAYAPRVDDGSDLVYSDSSDEGDFPQDAYESAQARAADGEDWEG